jgi:hypothetical protein
VPVEWELRGLVLRLVFTGLVERHEIEEALAGALADPRFVRGLGLLWDGRDSQTPLSTEDLRWRFDLVAGLAARGVVRRAAVLLTERWRATLDYLRSEVSRMRPGFLLETFTDEGEAVAWLTAGEGGDEGP